MASGLVLWCTIDWLFGVGSISAVEFKRISFGFGVWEWTLILDSPFRSGFNGVLLGSL